MMITPYPRSAEETEKNVKLSAILKGYIEAAGGVPMDKTKGELLYEIAALIAKPGDGSGWIRPYANLLLGYIKADKMASKVQLEAAFKYFKGLPVKAGSEVTKLDDEAKFIETTGVGIVITPEQIQAAVAAALDAKKDQVAAQRYRILFVIMAEVRETLKWADGSAIKAELEAQLAAVLGPKTEADLAKPKKEKKKKTKKENKTGGAKSNEDAAAAQAESGASLKFHAPGENYTTSGYIVTDTTMDHMKAHLKRTGGQVRTRFPPEPNGVLHIGHAKAINFNFSYAAKNGGKTFLRYDDTNPEKEEERFFRGILENVEWLGWTPCAVTHSSDYFQELYV